MALTDRVVERVRKMCLAFPEVRETSAWGHPNFKAGTRTFATVESFERQPSIAFRQAPAAIEALLRRKGFFATPYGRGQWVSLRVDGATDWRAVEDLLEQSYRLVALKRMIAALDAGRRA